MSLSAEEQIGFPGRYILETLELENFNGDKIELVDFFTSISYTEDIFSPVIYGAVSISDGIDIHQYLPICGEETLRLVYTSTENEQVDKTFAVYRIGNKSTASNNAERYTIYFCSKELITDKRVRVSKSYKNKLLSDIISDVVANYLETDKEFEVESTLGTYHTIIPYLSPLQTIQWCAANSLSPNSKGALYTFYEDRDGLKYANIETLMSNAVVNPDIPIRYNPQSIESGNRDQRFPEVTLIEYNIDRASKDLLNSMTDGTFANRMYMIDLLTREHRTQDYTYEENGEDTIHIDTASLLSPNYSFYEPEQKTVVRTTRTYRGESSYYEENHTGELYNEPENVIGYRAAQIGQLTSIAVIGKMYGVTDYTAGMTVELNIPNNTKLESKQSEEDHKYLTGKFLIKSIKHVLTVDGYFMDVTFLKDSLHSELEYDFD